MCPTCSAGSIDLCRAQGVGWRTGVKVYVCGAGSLGVCCRVLNPEQEILREALSIKSPVIRLPTALYLRIRGREREGGECGQS